MDLVRGSLLPLVQVRLGRRGVAVLVGVGGLVGGTRGALLVLLLIGRHGGDGGGGEGSR